MLKIHKLNVTYILLYTFGFVNFFSGSLKAIAKKFIAAGYSLSGTEGTAAYLQAAGIECEKINKVREGRPHIVDALKNGEIAMAVNTVNNDAKSIKDSHAIRRNALNGRIPLYTTTAGGAAVAEAVQSLNKTSVVSVQEMHGLK
ncbi:MAG: hypothetical protein IKH45_08030 [Neisseriaceae bacterium]|nr:hypothetical protein [Neisseriaceae bacterium]